MTPFLDACRTTLGAAHVIADPADIAAYLTDWRGRFTGAAIAVLRFRRKDITS